MQRITILNMKGGCGKTTMATNLAAYYANKNKVTTLIDYDPQGSSYNWLTKRDNCCSYIHSVAAFNRNKATTRPWQLRPPRNTEIVISDTPAGIDKLSLTKFVNQSDVILIPIMPSKVDMHSAAHFIEMLLIYAKAKAKGKRIGIIANRIRTDTTSFHALERFISHLDIPLVARFNGLESYVDAISIGVGIHELPQRRADRETEQWDQLSIWLSKKYEYM